MTLSELIKEYGDDKITFQNLDTDILSMDKKKSHYEYKFGSREPFNHNGTQKRALIVWLDRDISQEILDKAKLRRK